MMFVKTTMSKTLTLPNELYDRLEKTAQQQGFENVEELLEAWQTEADEREQKQRAVDEIDALREKLFLKYGEMPDSAELLREDRER